MMSWALIFTICSALSLSTPPINALNNGLALTPPMGWLSWERFACNTDCTESPNDCISSKLYREMADRLVSDGYFELGYNYVNIDDCWSEMERDSSTENLVADARRFPEGISELADHIHSKKLKIGIYGDCGTKTCGGYPAQLKNESNLEDNYFELDAKQLANWQVDSFKFDGCYIDPKKAESICPAFSRAVASAGRPTLIICEWPFYMLRERYEMRQQLTPDFKLAQQACNAWRYYEDVEDSWLSILSIVDFTIKIQKTIVKYHGPGHWFDPDQLVIGNFALSLDQARAQMAIWCIWSAPLYMSNDLRDIRPEMAAILKNEQLIEVNQDPMGIFGLMVAEKEGNRYQAFVKPVEPIIDGCPSFVVVYLSRQTLGDKRYLSFNLRQLLLGVDYSLVADRHNKQQKVNSMRGKSCRDFIQTAMTKDPANGELLNRPADAAEPKTEHKQVHYKVHDLMDQSETGRIGLNEDLTLLVNPSGVRAVKLVRTN